MMIFLEELTSWVEVERVAATPGIVTCIRSDGAGDIGPNHDRAREAWEQHYPKALRYFCLIDGDRYETVGYVRILCPSTGETLTPSTWCLDFGKPLDYQAIRAVAKLIKPAVLLTKKSTTNSKNADLTVDWPAISAAFPQLDRYSYRIQTGAESSWLLVPS
jgi:hypothetical protein